MLDEEARAKTIAKKIWNLMGKGLVTIAWALGIFLALCSLVTFMSLLAWTMVK